MCWETDYRFFAEQKKAEEARVEQERRARRIDQLLRDANRHGEETKVKEAQASERAPAK
jgi:hypothetical protein